MNGDTETVEGLLLRIRDARRQAVALKNNGDRRGALDALREAKALEARRQALLAGASAATAGDFTSSAGAGNAATAGKFSDTGGAVSAPLVPPATTTATADMAAPASAAAAAAAPATVTATTTATASEAPGGDAVVARRWNSYTDSNGKIYYHDELSRDGLGRRGLGRSSGAQRALHGRSCPPRKETG